MGRKMEQQMTTTTMKKEEKATTTTNRERRKKKINLVAKGAKQNMNMEVLVDEESIYVNRFEYVNFTVFVSNSTYATIGGF